MHVHTQLFVFSLSSNVHGHNVLHLLKSDTKLFRCAVAAFMPRPSKDKASDFKMTAVGHGSAVDGEQLYA